MTSATINLKKIRAYNTLIAATTVDFERDSEDSALDLFDKSNPIYLTSFGPYTLFHISKDQSKFRTTIPLSHTRRIRNYLDENPCILANIRGSEAVKSWVRCIEMMTEPRRHQLRRTFNLGSFRYGGRFYWNPCQNLPKGLRKRLTLNGQPVVELDYSALHTSMLYHEAKLEVPPLPYLFEKGDPMRDVVKTVMNIALNADDDHEAVQSAVMELNFENQHLLPALMHSRFWEENSYGACANILNELRRFHNPISGAFCKGVWKRLQRKDSDLASNILWHFTSKDIPIIPIHDSFISPEQHRDELDCVMREFYLKQFGKHISVE